MGFLTLPSSSPTSTKDKHHHFKLSIRTCSLKLINYYILIHLIYAILISLGSNYFSNQNVILPKVRCFTGVCDNNVPFIKQICNLIKTDIKEINELFIVKNMLNSIH